MFAVSNPCNTDKGGCEDTCTWNNDAAVCTCTSGSLNTDGKKCDKGNANLLIQLRTLT